MIKYVIKEMININIKAKRENMVIYGMWGIGMTPYCGEFLENDYVFPKNYLYCGLKGF